MIEGIKRRIIEGRISILGQTLKHAGWNAEDIQRVTDDARAAGNVKTLSRQVDEALHGPSKPRDMRNFENVPQRVNEEGATVYGLNGKFIKAVVKTAWEEASTKSARHARPEVGNTEENESTQSFRR